MRTIPPLADRPTSARPWLAGLATGLLALTAAAAAMADGPTGIVYTADEHGNSISSIDLATGQVAIQPVAISPHNVQVTADGARLLAVGDPAASGHGHGHDVAADEAAAGLLLVFDAGDLAAGPLAEIAVGAHPAHVVADLEGRRAFVTSAGDDAVTVVDLAAEAVIATIGTGSYPHGLRLGPDGRTLYVANVEDGSVSVIDTEGLAEVARIPVGTAPVQVGFTPDGARVYVSLRDENRVAVIDTAARSVIGTIDVGRNPIQVHATPEGRFVYVANQGSDAAPADTVSVIEIATGRVVDSIRTGLGAHGVGVSGDGSYVFVTNIVDGTVSVIDTATRAVVATFQVGDGPNGITWRPAAAAPRRQAADSVQQGERS